MVSLRPWHHIVGSSLVLPLTALVTKEIQENLAKEYFLVKQDLEVDNLLGYYGEMNEETRQEYLREAALELWREGREEALNGLKNLLADIVAILTLVGLVLIGRKQVALIGTVSNQSFLNLPDPLKVFIFILITTIVGKWEHLQQKNSLLILYRLDRIVSLSVNS